MSALAYIALGLAVVAVLCAIVARRRRAAAERAWRETCARYPWRVAAVFDGGPLVLLAGDPTPDAPAATLPAALDAADAFLRTHATTATKGP